MFPLIIDRVIFISLVLAEYAIAMVQPFYEHCLSIDNYGHPPRRLHLTEVARTIVMEDDRYCRPGYTVEKEMTIGNQ